MHLPVENYIWLKCGWTHYQCNSGDVSWILRRFFDARGANRQTGSRGEARWTWTGPVTFPFSFLEREGLQKKISAILQQQKKPEMVLSSELRAVTGLLCICRPAAVLGCYLQIRRTMRGRGGWKAVRQSDESPGGRSTRVTWKPPKKRKLPATQK